MSPDCMSEPPTATHFPESPAAELLRPSVENAALSATPSEPAARIGHPRQQVGAHPVSDVVLRQQGLSPSSS